MKRSDRRNRLGDIASVAASLRAAPIEAPDFTSSILDRVDAERAFLAPSVRRRIHISRWVMGASVAMVALGVALTFRWSPTIATIGGGPAPIGAMVRTVENRADMNFDAIKESVRSVSIPEPTRLLAVMTASTCAIDFESTPEPKAIEALTLRPAAPVFTGPVLPLATAITMEPAQSHAAAVSQIQSRWRVRPATSDINAISVRERANARAILDSLSVGSSSALLDHESDGLPVIR